RLETGAADHPGLRHGVLPRFSAAVVLLHRGRQRLRLHPRPDHPHRRGRGVPVHQSHGHPAGQDQVLWAGTPTFRPRPGTAGRPRAVAGLGTAPGRQPGPDLSEGGVMSRLGNVGGRLYRGEVSVEFVSRRRLWYAISGLILLISIGALAGRGLNFSVDFKGGSVFQFADPHASIIQVRSTVTSSGGGFDAIVQQVGSGAKASWRVQTGKLPYAVAQQVQDGLGRAFGLSNNKVSLTFVGPTWGSQITDKALQALIAFLVVIVIYLSIAFEREMAAAALHSKA